MEEAKLILYKVVGSGLFSSDVFVTSTEAENIAHTTRGIVIEIIK